MNLFFQPHLFQRFLRPFGPFCLADAGNRQRQFDICQNGLMGNQIIALKNKTDRVIPVGIPVSVLIPFCGNSVNNQIAVIIAVQAADDVQQGRFSLSCQVISKKNCRFLQLKETILIASSVLEKNFSFPTPVLAFPSFL